MYLCLAVNLSIYLRPSMIYKTDHSDKFHVVHEVSSSLCYQFIFFAVDRLEEPIEALDATLCHQTRVELVGQGHKTFFALSWRSGQLA
jgi:hypothetical protein